MVIESIKDNIAVIRCNENCFTYDLSKESDYKLYSNLIIGMDMILNNYLILTTDMEYKPLRRTTITLYTIDENTIGYKLVAQNGITPLDYSSGTIDKVSFEKMIEIGRENITKWSFAHTVEVID